jgi:hypothetical protein
VYVFRMSLHRKLHILKNSLAENEANRPSCSFVPSSYDSRNCIALFCCISYAVGFSISESFLHHSLPIPLNVVYFFNKDNIKKISFRKTKFFVRVYKK